MKEIRTTQSRVLSEGDGRIASRSSGDARLERTSHFVEVGIPGVKKRSSSLLSLTRRLRSTFFSATLNMLDGSRTARMTSWYSCTAGLSSASTCFLWRFDGKRAGLQ